MSSKNLLKQNSVFCDVPSVFIELTSKCNMDCNFCPYSVLKRENQDMKHEHVLKILEELKGGKADVTFHVLGEPLLNKHFFEYATLCDQYDINYWLTTNGLQFSSSNMEKLFSLSNLKLVEVSFHTISNEAIKLRGLPDLQLDKYLAMVKKAVFNEKRLNSDTEIRIDVMYDLHLQHDLLWKAFNYNDWVSFCDIMESWADELNTLYPEAKERFPKYFHGKKKIFRRGTSAVYRRRVDLPPKLFLELPSDVAWLHWEIFPNVFVTLKKFFIFSKSEEYLQQIFSVNKASIKVEPLLKFDKCELADTLAVLSNGDITFCCLDYEGDLSCGNIENMSLAEAALSSRRKMLMTKPDTFPVCRKCKGQIILI